MTKLIGRKNQEQAGILYEVTIWVNIRWHIAWIIFFHHPFLPVGFSMELRHVTSHIHAKQCLALANVQYVFSPRFLCWVFTLYTKYHHHSYITYTTSQHVLRLCKQYALCTTGQTLILMPHASDSFPGHSGCSGMA